MNNLSDLCLHYIAEQINEAPPMIQDMIINETKETIKNNVKKEIRNEIRNDLFNELNILSTIIPSITKSIIICRSNFNEKPNFYEIYKNIPKDIVQLAINISEKNVYQLNNSFNILYYVSANARYRFYTSDNESNNENEQDEDNEYSSDNSNEYN